MSPCPELELLFAALESGEGEELEHAATCPHCSAVLEEHRQMEKDLFRLADPLPPVHFVSQVMARVSAAPPPLGAEVKTGLSILAAALSLAAASFVLGHGHVAHLGTSVASSVVSGRVFIGAISNALAAVWHSAAVPTALTLSAMFLLSLVGLRKVSPSHSTELVRVTS